jgi:hypothetical protein
MEQYKLSQTKGCTMIKTQGLSVPIFFGWREGVGAWGGLRLRRRRGQEVNRVRLIRILASSVLRAVLVIVVAAFIVGSIGVDDMQHSSSSTRE